MKILIVFLGILLINVSFLALDSDLDLYEMRHVVLKAAPD